MTSPMKSSGATTSTFMIGSRIAGVGLADAVLDGHRAGDLEGHLRGVDLVERAVDQGRLQVDHREPGHHPAGQRVADPLLDRLPELLRNRSADDLRLELDAGAALERLDGDHGVAVLALATGLAHEAALALGGLADRLAVADLRPADVGLDLELAQHPVDDHLEVQLAHAGDARLARLLVAADAEGRVLLAEALEGERHLVLVGLRLRLDGELDHRLGEGDRLEDDRLRLVAERVAGEGGLEADGRGDVAGADRLDLLAVVGVQLDQAPDPLLLALGRVVDVRAGLRATRSRRGRRRACRRTDRRRS